MDRAIAPGSIAIVGLSDDPTKHGGRVLENLRKLGFEGTIVGVNPRQPLVEGVEVVGRLGDLTQPPDLVVSAVPAGATPDVVADAAGCGAVIVFAGGFAEAGADGRALQERLAVAAAESGVMVLGPNSGGIIRPGIGLAASFLTCLDRPPDEIRPGPVGLVTQSGGTGSYVHNVAAAAGTGLAVSISTGNEAVAGIADGIRAVAALPEVEVVAVVLETVRDGGAFIEAVGAAHEAGKRVVACRIGASEHGSRLMSTHTGAMAAPARVLDGVLDSLGIVAAETPEEMFFVADVLARTGRVDGRRLGVVTHSGGIAILLTDLAERHGIELPSPGKRLVEELEPLLHQGAPNNPLDMGGIIGGPGRFSEVVDRFAGSGQFDCVLAVSTAHPPAHTVERVEGLLGLEPAVPVAHLWMAGDLGDAGLTMLRTAGRAVAVEPRAAMRAMAALTTKPLRHTPSVPVPAAIEAPSTEHEAKTKAASWGLPVVEGDLASDSDDAVEIAGRLGGPVAMKISAPGVVHKTEAGGVRLGVDGPDAVRRAFADVMESAPDTAVGVRVERMASGFEVIVGLVRDPVFGPMVMLGPGGIGAEGMRLERWSLAPVDRNRAERLIGAVPGLSTALGRLGGPASIGLAELIAAAGERFVSSGLSAMEMNPVAWSGERWQILDVVMVSGRAEGAQ